MLMRKSTPMPTVAKVLSNSSLIARGHNSVDVPWVPVGTVVKVEAVEEYARRAYARFFYEGVTCYLPVTDLEELCVTDPDDLAQQTEEGLWGEILDRLDAFPPDEAQAELNSLLDTIRDAGGTRDIFIIFAQSWLSVVRA